MFFLAVSDQLEEKQENCEYAKNKNLRIQETLDLVERERCRELHGMEWKHLFIRLCIWD